MRDVQHLLAQRFGQVSVTPRTKGAFGVYHAGRSLPDLDLLCESFETATRFRPMGDVSFAALTVPIIGRAEVREIGGEAQAGPGEILATDHQIRSVDWSAGGQFLTLRISQSALRDLAARMLDRSVAEHVRFAATVPLSSDLVWIQQLSILSGVLGQSETGPSRDRLVHECQRALLTTLLLSHENSLTAELHKPQAPAAPLHVRKAIRLIEEHFSDAITLEDLVTAAGVSASALNSGFKAAHGQPPMAYLRDFRLARARDALIGDKNQSVSAIALDAGFSHLGRFAASYRRRYGETPQQTHRYRT